MSVGINISMSMSTRKYMSTPFLNSVGVEYCLLHCSTLERASRSLLRQVCHEGLFRCFFLSFFSVCFFVVLGGFLVRKMLQEGAKMEPKCFRNAACKQQGRFLKMNESIAPAAFFQLHRASKSNKNRSKIHLFFDFVFELVF